jgi:hypothetical protein
MLQSSLFIIRLCEIAFKGYYMTWTIFTYRLGIWQNSQVDDITIIIKTDTDAHKHSLSASDRTELKLNEIMVVSTTVINHSGRQ